MTIIEYAKKFIGTSYAWGGNTPEQGFDCSGFVCELLRAFGYIGIQDYTAQQLYHLLKDDMYYSVIQPESILFFGKSVSEISHVAIAINHNLMIEAGGEGRENSSNGFVRVRPIKHRDDLIVSCIIVWAELALFEL